MEESDIRVVLWTILVEPKVNREPAEDDELQRVRDKALIPVLTGIINNYIFLGKPKSALLKSLSKTMNLFINQQNRIRSLRNK